MRPAKLSLHAAHCVCAPAPRPIAPPQPPCPPAHPTPTQSKHRLFLGGLPHDLDRAGLEAALGDRVRGEPCWVSMPRRLGQQRGSQGVCGGCRGWVRRGAVPGPLQPLLGKAVRTGPLLSQLCQPLSLATRLASPPDPSATPRRCPPPPPLPARPTRLASCRLRLVRRSAPGLENVEIVMNKENPSLNRGFAFLEFYNSACAQRAKSALSAPDFT